MNEISRKLCLQVPQDVIDLYGGVLEEGLHCRVERQLEPGQAVLRGLARREHDAGYS